MAASPPNSRGSLRSGLPRCQRGGALRPGVKHDWRLRGHTLRSGQRGRVLRSGVKPSWRPRGSALRSGSHEGRAGPALHGGLGRAHWRLPGCSMPSACGQARGPLGWQGAEANPLCSERLRPGAHAADSWRVPGAFCAPWRPHPRPCQEAARLPQSIGFIAGGRSLRAGLSDRGGPRGGTPALQPGPAWGAAAASRLEVDHCGGRQRRRRDGCAAGVAAWPD